LKGLGENPEKKKEMGKEVGYYLEGKEEVRGLFGRKKSGPQKAWGENEERD